MAALFTFKVKQGGKSGLHRAGWSLIATVMLIAS